MENDKTKDWPRADGESMEDMNKRIQKQALSEGHALVPGGFNSESI